MLSVSLNKTFPSSFIPFFPFTLRKKMSIYFPPDTKSVNYVTLEIISIILNVDQDCAILSHINTKNSPYMGRGTCCFDQYQSWQLLSPCHAKRMGHLIHKQICDDCWVVCTSNHKQFIFLGKKYNMRLCFRATAALGWILNIPTEAWTTEKKY